MFVVIITFTKPLEIVDQHVQEHRAYLDECYAKNYLVVSGPQQPRTGGILVSSLSDRNLLNQLIENDPYHKNNIAEYQIIEFLPVKYHHKFQSFLN